MRIALDYDKTYTLDPALWQAFTSAAVSRGHEVVCVTAREDNEKNRSEVVIPRVPVYFTSFRSKVWYMENVEKIAIDVWVDDDPRMCAFGNPDLAAKNKRVKVRVRR